MNQKVPILIAFLLISFSVLAQTSNTDRAYSWLIGRPNTDVFGASLTALAISRADASQTQPYLEYIKTHKHVTQACWPNPTCTIKDTSAALLVEKKIGLGMQGVSTQEISAWLASKQISANLPGTWNLQIITPSIGQCGLRYQRQGEQQSSELTLTVNKGKISYGNCQNQYFFNINACLGNNILSKPSTIIEVSCQSLSSASLSIVYQEGSSIYLMGSPISTRGKFIINNGFFGNKLDTLYANWALEGTDSINSIIYLKKNQENKVLDQSLLYLITKEGSFLNNLLTFQTEFGQFSDQETQANEFNNGLAGLALQENGQHSPELEKLKEWLITKQKQDGSWGNNEKTTAVVLYGAYQGGIISTTSVAQCQNGIRESNEQCDGSSWGNVTGCQDLGFTGGTLSCTPLCQFNTSACSGQQGAQCNDGRDNDGDGFCDISTSICRDNTIPGDRDCASITDNSESSTQQTNCILSNPRWLNQNGISITTARGTSTNSIPGDTVLAAVDGNILCAGEQIRFRVFEDESGTDPLETTLGPVSFNQQEGFVFTPWQPRWFDDDSLPSVEGDPEFYFIATATNIESSNSSILRITKPVTTECSDGIDNDNNGRCDTSIGTCSNSSVLAGDLGCTNSNDLIESATALACADGIDNDADNKTDALDPGCTSPFQFDNSEVDGECVPTWSCDPWSICSVAGTQTRICRDLNACGISCPQGNSTCATARSCPGGNGTINLPDDGDDDTDTDTGTGPANTASNPCSVNDICEPEWGENEQNCPDDCSPKTTTDTTTGDDTGFGDEEPPVTEQEETQEGRSSVWVVVIIILLILILAGTYFFVLKKQPRKSKGSRTFELPIQPSRPPLFGPEKPSSKPFITAQRKEKKSKTEEELERSLREAKRLLER